MKSPLELRDELEKSEAWKRLARLKHFGVSFFIFRQNSEELRKLIEWARLPQNSLQLWSIQNRELLDQTQLQMLRLLHNFVAAAFSLIDHARIFFRDNYVSSGVFQDYEEQVTKRFKEDPFAQFIVGLRKYCQHYAVPGIFNELSVQLDKGKQVSQEHKIYLDRDSLLRFNDGWGTEGIKYLRSAPQNIDLLGIVTDYEQKVVEFYQWVDGRLKEIHVNDVAIIEQKQEEMRQAIQKHMQAGE